MKKRAERKIKREVNKKSLKIALLSLVFVPLGGIIWLCTAKAEVIASSSASWDSTNLRAYQSSDGNPHYTNMPLQGFTLSDIKSISKVSFLLDTNEGDTQAWIYSYDLTTPLASSSVVASSTGTDWVEYNFTPQNFSAGQYWIVLEMITMDASGHSASVYSLCSMSSGDPYAGGQADCKSANAGSGTGDRMILPQDLSARPNNCSNTCAGGGYGKDYAFILEGTQGVNTISMVFPTNGTSTPDFSKFIVDYTLATSTPNATNYACVEYVANFETTVHTDCENIDSGTSDVSFDITKTIPYSYLGTINARASLRGNVYTDLYNYTTTYYATSSAISWTNTGENTQGFYEEPTSTLTISSSTINCSGQGIFADSLCYVFKYLFVPAPTVLSQWSGLWDTIKRKPPIGYFTVFMSELSGLNASGTPAYAMPDVSNIQFFTDLKVGVGTLLSLLLVFYVIHRFKTIKI